MGIEFKVGITVVFALVGVAIWSIPKHWKCAGPAGLWKQGERDLIRRMMFREDGTLRRYTRHFLLLWFTLVLTWLWVFFP